MHWSTHRALTTLAVHRHSELDDQMDEAIALASMRRYPQPKTGPHTGWTPDRDRQAQRRFRNALLARSNGHCERCGTTTGPMQAHHTQPGYTPNCGLLLCQTCHRIEDPHAR